ncbi:MAG: hypothetical protein Q8N81_02165 [bacterium]|nr:hypothetical protein [bacterium]
MANKTDKLALIAQMIDSAESSIQSAKHLLREVIGNRPDGVSEIFKKAQGLSVSATGKVIEGVFDGQNMIGPDNKQYPVPANYASKSKLVEGDVLKLTIADDGSFIYKQIGPVERKKMLGLLSQDETGQYRVVADGKSYKILLASLTYFKAEAGDEITIVVPKEGDATWAAVEHVIKQGTSVPASEQDSPVLKRQEDTDEDLDLEE